ncbi:BRCA1-associated RING domain protein 1 [Herrania umbratica]|uniref:RING-type E3 ubiquitin transferase BRCA1 n=1 Tax=Herrania umbratica TaxID=108875 RepID=A0A6J1A1W4_9ROSI|nr:BRCA1-associated RING domain protein 1 [Herrania umbratica]
MGDFAKQNSNRAMNPWVLHLQKLGLELKCPLCLNLFKQPSLLPCDHLFCHSCVVRSAEFGPGCPICKTQYANRDLRPVTFMENIVGIYRSLDAAFSANISQCVVDGVGKNDISVKCSMQRHDEDKRYKTPNKGGVECNSAGKVDLLGPISQKQVGASQESGNGQISMSRGDQTSLGSPPSSGDTKDSDNDSSDQSRGNYPAKGLGKRNFEEKLDDSVLGVAHLWDSKRQKGLNYGPLETGVENIGHCQPVLPAQNLLTSNFQLGSQNGAPLSGADLPVISDDFYGNRAICGFCQSSRISEPTGPMLHYANGKPVTGDAAFCSNVIHVHSSCIEWAPQVYYVGESVKNLKAELARGAKLKCSRCGLKGAALGCYMKSCRRSYHFPCAKEVPKCRWDHDNFLVLCPAHSSVKFPNEKSGNAHSSVKFPNEKSGRCITADHCESTEIDPSKFSLFWGQPAEKKEWVFCGSALSSEEKFVLVKFAKNIGVTVSKFWKPDVTHVIASTDENGACTRTLKVLMAISNGKWVLKMDWIMVCMKAIYPVNEEPYEVILDNHGCSDGPKTGRLRALDNAPKLFDGFRFYFVGDFVSGYKEDLQNLVVAAGGTVLRIMEELLEQNNGDQAVQTRMIVVYNLDAPKGSELGEEVSIIWQRMNEAQDLATKIGGQVIGHTWLLESVAAYKLQPFVS